MAQESADKKFDILTLTLLTLHKENIHLQKELKVYQCVQQTLMD